MRLWRISSFATLDGKGGLLREGRWHSKGHAIVYVSDHPATALCELLVQAPWNLLPSTFQLLAVECPDTLRPERVHGLPVDWRLQAEDTRRRGDRWLRAGTAALLEVPSAVVPHAMNYLINPAHPDAPSMRIESIESVSMDHRLRAMA